MQLSAVHMEAVQYVLPNAGQEIEPLGDNDHDVLSQIRQVLVDHGCEDRFGVSLLARDFKLTDEESVIEVTNDAERKSTWNVINSDSPQLSQSGVLKTNWEFFPTSEAKVASCRVKCFYNWGHKTEHTWW